NRRVLGLVNNYTADRTTASTTYIEGNTEIRCEFVTWADEAVFASVQGVNSNNTNSADSNTAIGFDGTNQENGINAAAQSTATPNCPIGLTLYKSGLAEGYHYATVLIAVSSGTGTWRGGTFASDTTRRNITSLAVAVRG